DPAPRAGVVRGPRQPVRGDALPFPDRGAGVTAREARAHGVDARGRDHGLEAHGPRDLGSPVPSRVGAHPPGPQADRELPGALQAAGRGPAMSAGITGTPPRNKESVAL